ncbi:MAG: zinc transporter ZntB, partial [Gammaproteobacteria bacterium]|nr:zinc transporter ZntB [Gammaproteobacteria bacterium]
TGNKHGVEWLMQRAGLDPLIAEALSAGETRPRSAATDDGLLVILRGVNTNPGADPEDMVSVRVWIERDRIISVRRRRLLSVQDIRAALADGVGPKSSGDFLIMLLERIAARIGDVVGRIDDAVDAIEDEVESGDVPSLQRRTSSLRRQTAAIRRYLAPQREALNRIRGKTELLTPHEIHDLEEQSDSMTRYLEDLELLREQTILINEQLTTRMANEQNQRLYILSIVAAIFLPLSFITGLLGMNVAGLPGVEYNPAFWISIGIMGAIATAMLVYFRYKRWI